MSAEKGSLLGVHYCWRPLFLSLHMTNGKSSPPRPFSRRTFQSTVHG